MLMSNFLLILYALEQGFSHPVYVIIADALAKFDKEGRVEACLVSEFRKAAHVLYVGICLIHCKGNRVRQARHMFDDHGTGILVVERQLVTLAKFISGEMVTRTCPAVHLVHPVKGRT